MLRHTLKYFEEATELVVDEHVCGQLGAQLRVLGRLVVQLVAGHLAQLGREHLQADALRQQLPERVLGNTLFELVAHYSI